MMVAHVKVRHGNLKVVAIVAQLRPCLMCFYKCEYSCSHVCSVMYVEAHVIWTGTTEASAC